MEVFDKQVYRIEGVEVDPSQGCLRRNGEEINVRQKSLRALVYMLEHRHRLVTKEELIGHVWEGQAVTSDALVQLIKELRRGLNDDPHNPRFIKTVPRHGYRFIAPVEESYFAAPAAEIERNSSVEIEYEEEMADQEPRGSNTTSRARAVAAAAVVAAILVGALATYLMTRPSASDGQLPEVSLPHVPGKRAVAVVYFENRSGDRELDWLREGLADMLITDLSRSQKLSVLGRGQLHLLLERIGHDAESNVGLDEAMEVARGTRAEVVVMGSFARIEGKIRVDVQLYDATEGRLLTAERVVVEQAAQILTQVDLLAVKLANYLSAPADHEVNAGLTSVLTNNLMAYRYYSLGVEKAQTLLYVDAVALLEKAVALDPKFAMAHARIGYTYALCWARPDEAKPHLEKAFQLSGGLTEKDKLSVAAWYAVANEDYQSAIEQYRNIISRYPLEVEAYWRLARLLRGEVRMQESVEVAKQGLVIDPAAKELYNVLGVTYMEMGRHDEAIAALHRYIELSPEDPNIYDSLGMAYQWAGRYPEAISTLEKALSLNPEFEIAIIHLGNAYAWHGRYAEAMRQYKRFIQVASFDANRRRGYSSLVRLHLKKGESVEAERAARAAMKYDKQNLDLQLMLAFERRDLASAEKLRAAVEAGRLIDKGNRGYERWRAYYRGYFALKSGRASEAVEHFKAALAHRPMGWYIDAYEDCLANAYLELGRLDEAIAEYERILRLNPNYPLALYHLAQAYERNGEQESARAAYQRFLDIWKDADADIPEVIAARERLGQARSE